MGYFYEPGHKAKFRFTPEQANWIIHHAIGDAGIVGLLMNEFMHPYDRLELFDCMYGQKKSAHFGGSEAWYKSEQRTELVEACKPYQDGALWLHYTPNHFERIRAALDLLEEQRTRKQDRK